MPDNDEKIGVKAYASRLREMGFREASALEHETMRILVDDIGAFTPELCNVQDKRQINAHWVPFFRSNSPKDYDDSENGSYWKSAHLYNIAGSFPCAPNIGSAHILDGVILPVNGWTANEKWTFVKSGKDAESGAVWALSILDSPEKKMPLGFTKIDALVPGENVHYSALKIMNNASSEVEICSGWQNMLGAPFFAPGCRISASAKEWFVPPAGSEFDATTRLAAGKEFISLSKAPLAKGGLSDISIASSPIGCTDFAVGAIPKSSTLGWSAVVNPLLKMVYVSFFPGPLAAEENDYIPIYFNNLLMQYGGRSWTPWAPYEGGTDLSYCLGQANETSAWTAGLEYSRSEKKILGSPTTWTLPAKTQKALYYGSLFDAYEDNILDNGIVGVEAEEGFLICKSSAESWKFKADAAFNLLKKL